MSLEIVYTDDFPLDVAVQARWYAEQAGEALALRYAGAVEATLEMLAMQPHLGCACDFVDSRLQELRYYLVLRPFHRHLIYYRVTAQELVAYRVVSGNRDLPRRLLEPPGSE